MLLLFINLAPVFFESFWNIPSFQYTSKIPSHAQRLHGNLQDAHAASPACASIHAVLEMRFPRRSKGWLPGLSASCLHGAGMLQRDVAAASPCLGAGTSKQPLKCFCVRREGCRVHLHSGSRRSPSPGCPGMEGRCWVLAGWKDAQLHGRTIPYRALSFCCASVTGLSESGRTVWTGSVRP